MTNARAIEYRITRQLLQRQHAAGDQGTRYGKWVERAISVAAVTAGLFVVGSYLQELLWALLAGGAVVCMGYSNKSQ